MTITITLTHIHCAHCGQPFAVTSQLFEARQTSGRWIGCPSCRRRSYFPKDRDNPAAVEKRREEVRRLHEQEQAEARLADAAVKALATCPQLREENPEPGKLATGDYNRRDQNGRRVCPHCDKTYLNSGCYGRHVRHAHGIEPATGGPWRNPFAKV